MKNEQKKEYVAPAMEEVELKSQVSLLSESELDAKEASNSYFD